MQYVAVSGGKDSVAMALLMHERGEEFELMFSDSGAELPEVFWLLPRLAKYLGRPLHVTAGASLFQWLIVHDYSLPSAWGRWCTRELKSVPQDAWLERAGNAESVCVGIRADEPRRIKDWATKGWTIRRPLVDAGLGREEVYALCRKHGLLNPIYDWRTSTSCFCCPFQRISDWRGLLSHHPTLYKVAEEWEEQAAERGKHRWRQSGTLREMREARDDQLGMFDEPDAEPCLICAL